jgi:hypothetical protein
MRMASPTGVTKILRRRCGPCGPRRGSFDDVADDVVLDDDPMRTFGTKSTTYADPR